MFIDVYGDTLGAMVSAAALASTGHQVTLHVSAGAVANGMQNDEFILREPGLAALLTEQKTAGRLSLADLQAGPSEGCTVLWLALSRKHDNRLRKLDSKRR